MLSYRHAYHAGNHADVLKHIILIEILQYLVQKEKGFDYIDTHAGAGIYSLETGYSTKLAEYREGVAKLKVDAFPELAAYFDVIQGVNPSNKLLYYPGSPCLAQQFLRPQDQAWLFELHPEDVLLLQQAVDSHPKIRVTKQDGLVGLLARVPPTSRRALVLIDPSYEIKADYEAVVETLIKAHQKFPTGVYCLWYPVVERARINKLEKKLINSGIRNIQLFELAIQADTDEYGMTSSGMIVINPPWQLMSFMTSLLPKLLAALPHQSGAFTRSQQLVEE